MNETIVIRNCCADYGQGAVLKDVSLTVYEGEFIVLIGSSGCGKTTLLKLVNGLMKPNRGEVTVNGEDVQACDLIALRRKIGYVVQGAKLFPHMSVADNICYVPSLTRRLKLSGKQELVKEMLELVQLPENFADRFPCQLSGGQQQRVGIARALAMRPRLLLMDEPFGAVDEITRRGLQKQIRMLQRKMKITTLFVTHDIREACCLGDRIVVMNEGRIVQEGSPEALKKNPKDDFVRQLFEDIR
ncbi:MAG: ABC transporter ATP-binding protein [Eubacteriales bacterium]|nr:ABC transporter ATP-binding protein [Eubacteriales bacterium]